MQALASAILAPSLRHVADSLALQWRKQLTAVTHKRYLQRINFYTVSNLAGMQVGHQLLLYPSNPATHIVCHVFLTIWLEEPVRRPGPFCTYCIRLLSMRCFDCQIT